MDQLDYTDPITKFPQKVEIKDVDERSALKIVINNCFVFTQYLNKILERLELLEEKVRKLEKKEV